MESVAQRASARDAKGSGVPPIEAAVRKTCEGIAQYMLNTADFTRVDRLWPAHFLLFATNPLSLAYGACGTAAFLQELHGELPDEIAGWMREQPLGIDTYPPGLYCGLAGIASGFYQCGLEEEAEAAMSLMFRSPLLLEEPGVFQGSAGCGLAALQFFAWTRKQTYLDRAVTIGEHLIGATLREQDACYWRVSQHSPVHFGFGYGASGIALFLLYLYCLTGRAAFRDYAMRSLEFDLANKVESPVGWQWKRFQGDTVLYPYWIHGSAGIGSVLIRFHHLLGIERYGVLARKIAEDTRIKYSFIPSLFEGLSGIGEFLSDMAYFTGDETYRAHAMDIAETILWFRIERPQGIAFPGRWLTKISNDYGTGSAGIGLFLLRMLDPRPRRFVDLDALCSVDTR